MRKTLFLLEGVVFMCKISSGRRGTNLLLILLGTLLAIHLFGGGTYTLSAFEIRTDVTLLTQNRTSLMIKPFGEIQAKTHHSPLSLCISLESIDLERLERDLTGKDPQLFFQEILKGEGRELLYSFLLRLLLCGGIGGGLFLYLVHREKRRFFEGFLIGLFITSLLLLSIYQTYTIDSFRNPSYYGMLEAAPWMMGLVEEGLRTIDLLGEQVRTVTKNLEEIFESIHALEPEKILASDLRVLHVSDIHNNPVAFHFIEEMIGTFQVDMVIDTGDLTDYGTTLEAEIGASISTFSVPYIFVPGNHDSPAVIEYLKGLEHVIVLEGGTLHIHGLQIVGLKDPAAERRELQTSDPDTIEDYREELKKLTQDLKRPPTIVAVHNKVLADNLLGEVPIILHGHTHRMNMYQERGTVVIDAGTTGAAGLRGLEGRQDIPYSLALLHFKEEGEEDYRLMAVDLIRIRSRGGGFQLERVAVDSSLNEGY